MCRRLKHFGPVVISNAGPGKLMIFFKIKFAIFLLACMAHSSMKEKIMVSIKKIEFPALLSSEWGNFGQERVGKLKKKIA